MDDMVHRLHLFGEIYIQQIVQPMISILLRVQILLLLDGKQQIVVVLILW